jgi:hypothetical protein
MEVRISKLTEAIISSSNSKPDAFEFQQGRRFSFPKVEVATGFLSKRILSVTNRPRISAITCAG